MVAGRFQCFCLGLGILSSLANGSGGVVGVPESKQSLYKAKKNGDWACLNDAAVVIKASQINDGVCDCPDGSDEPGTGACGEKAPQFYCENEGFLPRYISQSKVGDGVCDCCDCSDEKLTEGEVFSRGALCEDLRVSFDEFVKHELEIHDRGVQRLRELKSQVETMGQQKSREELTQAIETLSEQLSSNERILASERAEYSKKLKEENPLLYEFEQLHVDSISNGVDELFDELITVGKAYEDLIRIFDALVEDHSAHLKDMVVNKNVEKYEHYKQRNLVTINCDPETDEDQRRELLIYFQTELPELFSTGLSDKPVRYNQGKAAFVDMLILSKAEYTEVIIGAIEKLRSMLQDVAKNYNRNYQDQGVKQAVESFRNYREKYGAVNVVRVPSDLMKGLDDLKQFVIKRAPELLPSTGDQDQEVISSGIIQHVQDWIQEIPSFFKPNIKHQISKHEQDVRSLRAELSKSRKVLSKLIEEESFITDERTKRVKSLIDVVNPRLEKSIGSYTYAVQYNGQILQKQNSGDENVAVIGNFKSLRLNDELALLKYKEYIRNNYSENDELIQHLISETTDNKEEYLFGNLYQLNNGLQLEFSRGDNCWDGPKRSAMVFVQCSDVVDLKKITETSRCRYLVEIESPFGCSQDFVYQPFSP